MARITPRAPPAQAVVVLSYPEPVLSIGGDRSGLPMTTPDGHDPGGGAGRYGTEVRRCVDPACVFTVAIWRNWKDGWPRACLRSVKQLLLQRLSARGPYKW